MNQECVCGKRPSRATRANRIIHYKTRVHLTWLRNNLSREQIRDSLHEHTFHNMRDIIYMFGNRNIAFYGAVLVANRNGVPYKELCANLIAAHPNEVEQIILDIAQRFSDDTFVPQDPHPHPQPQPQPHPRPPVSNIVDVPAKDGEPTCGICYTNVLAIASRCGHMLCGSCSDALVQRSMPCSKCRGPWTKLRRIYF
jgi:hypothetical protein